MLNSMEIRVIMFLVEKNGAFFKKKVQTKRSSIIRSQFFFGDHRSSFASKHEAIIKNFAGTACIGYPDLLDDTNDEFHSINLIQHVIEKSNFGMQGCIKSNKEFNNKEESRQEANNKQKGCQFRLSLPVVIDATDRPFLSNNEKAQGEVEC